MRSYNFKTRNTYYYQLLACNNHYHCSLYQNDFATNLRTINFLETTILTTLQTRLKILLEVLHPINSVQKK